MAAEFADFAKAGRLTFRPKGMLGNLFSSKTKGNYQNTGLKAFYFALIADSKYLVVFRSRQVVQHRTVPAKLDARADGLAGFAVPTSW